LTRQKLNLHPVAASVERRRSSRHFGIGLGEYLALSLSICTLLPDFASTISPLSSNLDVSSSPKTVVYLLRFSFQFDLLDPKCLPRCPNLRLDASTLDLILHPVKWQLGTKELEDLAFKILWYEGFKIEQIEMGLIFDLPTNCGWKRGQLFGDGFWEIWYWKEIC
jgi:hypothetical protein